MLIKPLKVEFLERELDEANLRERKNKKIEKHAKETFENRIKEAKRKAIEDNIEKATWESGNKLTQNIDENGRTY